MIYTLTPSIQDYLEVILKLSEENEKVRVTDIAKTLNIAKASVNQAINKLYDFKLVNKEKYGPITLTDKGKKEAMKIQYKHMIIRNFLINVLNVGPDIADKDACLIEHAVSPQTIVALFDFLERGNFINENIDLEEVKNMLSTSTLSDLSVGSKGIIKKIEATGSLRRRILEMGIVTGEEVLVKGVAPMGDPIEVVIKDYSLSLRKNEALLILVEVI